jgi:hypothetical protein
MLLLVHVSRVEASLTITVGDTNLPVGAGATIELFLQPSAGAVSGVGATLTYSPADLEVEYVGMNQLSLGGPTAAVHRAYDDDGLVIFAAARPAGTGYTAATNELVGLAQLVRLGTNTTTVTVDDAFVSLPGPPNFQAIPLSDIVFGITPADSDGDGVPDAWEFLFFGNLSTVGVGTDFDFDGTTDLSEFNAGTNPRIPFLTQEPGLGGIAPPAVQGQVGLSFPAEANVEYRLQCTSSPLNPVWTDIAFATTPGGVANITELVGSGGVESLYIDITLGGPAYYRIAVRE